MKSVRILNLSDVKIKQENGLVTEIRLKRKYGKFTRPVIQFDPNDIQSIKCNTKIEVVKYEPKTA